MIQKKVVTLLLILESMHSYIVLKTQMKVKTILYGMKFLITLDST